VFVSLNMLKDINENNNLEFKFNDRETVPAAISKAYFCSFLYKKLETSEINISKDLGKDVFKVGKALSPQPTKGKPKLTINQIALKYVYSELQITRDNGNEIVKQYGHNSGEKLFQKFTYYSSTANRKGKPTPCSLIKLDNKIKLLESVIKLVANEKQKRVKK